MGSHIAQVRLKRKISLGGEKCIERMPADYLVRQYPPTRNSRVQTHAAAISAPTPCAGPRRYCTAQAGSDDAPKPAAVMYFRTFGTSYEPLRI
jgi:hypothetical protein